MRHPLPPVPPVGMAIIRCQLWQVRTLFWLSWCYWERYSSLLIWSRAPHSDVSPSDIAISVVITSARTILQILIPINLSSLISCSVFSPLVTQGILETLDAQWGFYMYFPPRPEYQLSDGQSVALGCSQYHELRLNRVKRWDVWRPIL